jgi:hypothetical protein
VLRLERRRGLTYRFVFAAMTFSASPLLSGLCLFLATDLEVIANSDHTRYAEAEWMERGASRDEGAPEGLTS